MPLPTDLPTGIVPGAAAHTTGHNTTNTRVNDVAAEVNTHDTRIAAVETVDAASLTQGLYARTTVAPSGEAAGVLILRKDPNQNGVNATARLWGFGLTSGTIGYSDDYGATFTSVQAPPASASGLLPCQIEITSGVAGGDYMFILFNSSAANAGGLWRAPAPGASPTSLTLTCIQANDATNNIANGPGATPTHTGDGSNYRNQCFAIQPDGSHAYLVPYSTAASNATPTTRTDGFMAVGSDMLSLPTTFAFKAIMHGSTVTVSGAGAAGAGLTGTIMRIYGSSKVQLDVIAQTAVSNATVTFSTSTAPGDLFDGPYVDVSANPCASDPATVLWTSPKGWSMARHAHAVRVIGGVPWVTLGDYPYPPDIYNNYPPLTHVGVWASTSADGATWNQKLAAGAGAEFAVINLLPVTIGGQSMIVGESDGTQGIGPIVLPTQSSAAGLVVARSGRKPSLPVIGTMRCLAVTSEGNVMWYATGEGGSVGPVDGIFIAKTPFDTPVLLEQLTAGTGGVLLNATEAGPYVFMGKLRITREKFTGQ